MPKAPGVPHPFTQTQFGEILIRWGTGDAQARARIGTITRDELQNMRMTAELARQWRDFYRSEVQRVPSNPSARGRADLMQYVFELLEENDD